MFYYTWLLELVPREELIEHIKSGYSIGNIAISF
jgi:hypothetical protein